MDSKGLWSRIVEALGTDNMPLIAKTVGVKRHAVYKWRDGRSAPDLPNLIKIAKVTNSSLHWLITGEGARKVDKSTTDPNFVGVSFDSVLFRLLSTYAESIGKAREEVVKLFVHGALINLSLEGRFISVEARQLFISGMDHLEAMDGSSAKHRVKKTTKAGR